MNSNDKTLKIEYLPCMNYAMTMNGRRCIEYIELTNSTNDTWNEIRVSVSGELFTTDTMVVDKISSGQTFRLTELDVKPDKDKLRELTESVETQFTVDVVAGNESKMRKTFPLRLLAFDEWPGVDVMPEVLAAFVMPNMPELSRIKINAATYLEKLTGSSSLDEYQTQDPNRARAQVAAIYEALRCEGLVYSAPPASFEKTGQRVRLADTVLSSKLGTCMDLSLLMVSLLESCGLHPIIIIQQGHMYVGCWLIDHYCSHSVSDDLSYLSKATADGISQMVVVESTAITSSNAIPFEEAVSMAERHLVADQAKFVLFCDIYRCRMEGIRPLPMKVNGVWQNDGINHSNATEDVAKMEDITLDINKKGERSRQQIWERKLLDFSMRNNLLNLRIGRRVIPFASFQIDSIEDHLQEHEDFSIRSLDYGERKQKFSADEFGVYDSRLYKDQLEQLVVEDQKHHILNSYLSSEDLLTTQKTLFRESRTALEENGASTLYMVFGLMKWYETEKSVRPRYAPLLLLPVDLIRKSGNNYVIRRRDEEMTINTTLVEKLRQEYQIDLKGLQPLPEDEHGYDVRSILATVRAQLAGHAHWDVVDEVLLGLFSFNKFVMWNDIHNNEDKMRRSPIIESLLKKHWVGGNDEQNAKNTNISDIDRTIEPKELAMPVDVDSSQMEAVVESGEGHSFILYGPPGTGKSQTITNMIANALFHGKRVLFVAEKMAALEVVQKRLKKVGLDPFCLELHSNKVTKSHLLQQLKTTLELTRIKTPAEYEQASKELFEQRRQLTTYIEQLHKKQSSGLSLYDCIARFKAIEGEAIQPSGVFMNGLTKEKLQEAKEKIEALDTVFTITGQPSEHPLLGLSIYDPSQEAQSTIEERLSLITEQMGKTDSLISRLNALASFKQPHSMNGARWAAKLINRRQTLIENFGEGIIGQDVVSLRTRWTEIGEKWFLPRFFAKRSFMKMLRSISPMMKEVDVEPMLQQLEELRQQLQEIGLEKMPTLPVDEMQTCQQLVETVDGMKELCTFDDENFDTLRRQIPQWQQNINHSREWTQWSVRKRELEEMRLEKVVSRVSKDHITGHKAAQAMLKGAYRYMAMQIIDSDSQLQLFNGLLFEDAIEKYRNMAKEFQELTKKMLYCKLAANVPAQTIEPSAASELGILKRYIASNGRGATIRHIIDQIPTVLPRLCPVMLMSPISVAQFIDLDQPPFDIVCFDEASQMPTSEAVGAIARGKSLICVGDPKQMPPTNFFNTNTVDEDEADIDDMESILDDCITLSLPAHYLTWHYRSRHESLIAFSNAQYYDSKLYTFPSIDDRVSKVTLIPIDGTYDFGKSRSNRAEAEAIVKEVVRRLSDNELSKKSIGIVSFSKVQQNLIEDLLTEELAKNNELESKAYDAEEPIFIKNLENVQGDERDVILFSVGYGPDKRGKVSMNFGPLNNQGGERRLNVAVSRARCEMMVFSTLKPEQIDLRRSNALGVAGLKHFLEFAKNGRIPLNANQVEAKAEDTYIIESIAKEIRKIGFDVDTSVGRSEFKIDLAVSDPKDKDRYVLGIICDGTRYHETKTERDREICQPGVLNGLGWKLMRLWAVDWLMNKEAVMERIKKALTEMPPTPMMESEKPIKGKEKTAPSPLPFLVNADEILKPKANEKPAILKKLETHGPKPITDIAAKDIQEIVRFAVEQQISIPILDLKKHVSKLMGYPRRTPKFDRAIDLAIATLINKNCLTEENGNLTLNG
ncbi:MAG: DUF4011 domain-containing protein [Prevotella sp.]|nr:DUF4011 domain-containing protein [Prevotella sp.]